MTYHEHLTLDQTDPQAVPLTQIYCCFNQLGELINVKHLKGIINVCLEVILLKIKIAGSICSVVNDQIR